MPTSNLRIMVPYIIYFGYILCKKISGNNNITSTSLAYNGWFRSNIDQDSGFRIQSALYFI